MSLYAKHTTKALMVTIDIIMVIAAWICAYFLRFYSGIPIEKGIPNATIYYKLVPFIMVIWMLTFHLSGLYSRSRHSRSTILEGLDICQACFFSTLLFITTSFFYNEYKYSRLTLILFILIHPVALIAGRSFLRKLLRRYSNSSEKKRVLIIGGGSALQAALKSHSTTLQQNHIIGVIHHSRKNDPQTLADLKKSGLSLLKQPSNWSSFFSDNRTDFVIIALSYDSYDFLEHNLDDIAGQVVDVHLLPDILRFTKFSAGFDYIDNQPTFSLHQSPLHGSMVLLKRCLDIGGSLCALALFSPVMLLTAIGVKKSSQGPVFYQQERMGLDGKSFSIYKFRTMPTDSEKKSGAVWAQKSDGRATKFGQYLRKTSLDELPQLFNVLKGDMSLVGPRPERPVFVQSFRTSVPDYMLRHKVKAGITGWAQVNGWRGNTSIEKRIQCDLFYIQNWSFWLDIKILFMTIFKGFINPNAY